MIPLGWAVGVVSVGITSVAAILATQPFLTENAPSFIQVFRGTFVPYLLPYLVTVLFFTFVYKVIPTGNVSLMSALIGSAIFSALMEIAKQFFTWYVANYTAYNVIFGSLEAVVILVIWVFYIALIFLFCAELISSYQRRNMILIEKALLKPRKDGARHDERLLRKFGRTFGRDEYIFREGDIGRNIFYILNGRIRMEKGAGQARKITGRSGTGGIFRRNGGFDQRPAHRIRPVPRGVRHRRHRRGDAARAPARITARLPCSCSRSSQTGSGRRMRPWTSSPFPGSGSW